jgi:hypothetical protein
MMVRVDRRGILRHADFSITMEVYSQATPEATREAVRRLGEWLG